MDGWVMDRRMGQWVDDTRDHSLAELTHETDHHRSRWVCFCLSKEKGHGEKGFSRDPPRGGQGGISQ